VAARSQISVLIVTFDHGDAIDAVAGATLCAVGREDPREVRGTLGGLGLPGGPPPLLTPVRRIALPHRSGATR